MLRVRALHLVGTEVADFPAPSPPLRRPHLLKAGQARVEL